MPIMVNPSCPCCIGITPNNWHCHDCWDKYHNGERDKDFMEIIK